MLALSQEHGVVSDPSPNSSVEGGCKIKAYKLALSRSSQPGKCLRAVENEQRFRPVERKEVSFEGKLNNEVGKIPKISNEISLAETIHNRYLILHIYEPNCRPYDGGGRPLALMFEFKR